MSRRVMTWAATFAVATSLMMTPGVASANGEVGPAPTETAEPSPAPTTAPTTPAPTTPAPTTAPTTPAAPPPGGDVIVPDPTAPERGDPRVLVFGDSISAPGRYRATDTAGRVKAWWAWVAEGAGMDPRDVMLSAEAGSGIVSRGGGKHGRICTGSTFAERLDRIAATDPDVVMVEVGRNDIWDCVGTRRVQVSAAKRQRLASAYFDRLAAAADRNGIARSNVYVMTAWGSAHSDKQVPLTTAYENQVRARGFTWVPLAALTADQTTDGVHPTARGARTLATWALHASDLATAIASRGKRTGRVSSGSLVRCQGLKGCRTARLPVHAYGKAPRRVWGAPAATARHYVAHVLTSQKHPVGAVLTSSTARGWRQETVTSKAARQTSHPRVGDVAWWHTAPAGVGGSGGHVAIVERISADNSTVTVSEVTSRGLFRTVRYTGVSRPRGYLRFTSTDGSPRGVVTSVAAKRGAITVRGRAVDTDAEQRGVRIRVTVTQSGRTWTRTATRTRFAFSHRFSLPGLRRGPATVKVRALDAPRTRGKDRSLVTRRVTVR